MGSGGFHRVETAGAGVGAPAAVDVVILSWNRLRDTLAAIDSVRAQEGVQVKVWVVDQGSEQACRVELRNRAARGEIQLRELGENRGVAAGRNLGMALGSAPCVVGLDNDALLADARALLRAARRFEADDKLGAIGFRVRNLDTGEDDPRFWAYPRPLWAHRGEGFTATRFAGVGHALRRDALAQTRGYDERLFFYWEELDLSYQLIEAGWTIMYDPHIEVLHRVAPEMRTEWAGGRYYFHVRNALYLDYRYFRSSRRLLLLGMGYTLKGAINHALRQAGRGWRDALSMIRNLDRGIPPLSITARQYVWEHDTRWRGSVFRRLREEVAERLP